MNNKNIIFGGTKPWMMEEAFSEIMIILYINDQQESTFFYRQLLGIEPTLNVPGMTEFDIHQNLKLGLMPNSGIKKIIGNTMPDPASGSGIPRCELYLVNDNAEALFNHAVQCGAKVVDPFSMRSWGQQVGYIADPDGNIIAFAQQLP